MTLHMVESWVNAKACLNGSLAIPGACSTSFIRKKSNALRLALLLKWNRKEKRLLGYGFRLPHAL